MAWHRFLLMILLLTGGAGGAAAQDRDPAGRWALMADGRPVAILELQRNPAATGGWTGAWIRPERLSISQMRDVFDVGGPVVTRRILSVAARDDGFELIVEGAQPGAQSRQTLRLTDDDHAEFGWIDPLAIPPVPLVRVDADTNVASGWEQRQSFPITTPLPSNPEMKAIFEADQGDRRPASGQIDGPLFIRVIVRGRHAPENCSTPACSEAPMIFGTRPSSFSMVARRKIICWRTRSR